MSISDDKKTEIVTTLIMEDRTEARAIRGRTETVISSVVVASFAITAFWLQTPLESGKSVRHLGLLSDISLLAIILVTFSRSMLEPCPLSVNIGPPSPCRDDRSAHLSLMRDCEHASIGKYPQSRIAAL